jgi:cobalt-zinc-cadmium efflux system outer membrane protein
MRRIAAIALLLIGGIARADRTPVTLGAALAAIPHAPETQVAGPEIEAAEASIAAAGAWPSPSVHVGTNRLTAREIVGASVRLPVFGEVGAAKNVAAVHAKVVRADVEIARRDLRHRVVIAWIALSRAGGEVDATAVAARQAAELERIAQGRLSAGTGADVDVTVATAARARADVAAAAALRSEDAASAELAAVLGWDPAVPLRAAGTAPTGAPAELAALRAALAHHPQRAAALDRVLEAQATLRQTKIAYWPSLAIEGEVQLNDPTLTAAGSDQVIGPDAHVGIALDLPLFAHIGDRVRVARATVATERARLAVTDAQLAGGLIAAYRRWQAASERLTALEHDVMPAQSRAAQLSAQAYQEGARDLASAIAAERDLAAVQADVNAARADAATAWADLQLAAGEEVGQ